MPNTPRARSSKGRAGAVVLAALALPGVYLPQAHAETAPEKGVIAFKFLHYEDSQPGFKRVKVNSPSVYLSTPIGSEWSAEGSLTVDTLSGATPRWQSSVSSASVMNEDRKAGDVKVTRYFDRSSYGLGFARSTEHDYDSNALSLQGTWSSDDNNRTWNAGLGYSSDRINPTRGGQNGISGETKKAHEAIVGVTQVLSVNDIAQVNLTYSNGKGFYSDPYKALDVRPRERTQAALLGRWNHHFAGDGSSLRTSYRYYRDNFKIKAHTLELEWVKPVGSFAFTPLVRLYSQSSADFYVDAQYDPTGFPIFPDLAPGQLNSGDQRLSAFGAVTLGLKAEYKITPVWTIDSKLEAYEQRSNWRVGGDGSTGLDPFRAKFVQLGTSYQF